MSLFKNLARTDGQNSSSNQHPRVFLLRPQRGVSQIRNVYKKYTLNYRVLGVLHIYSTVLVYWKSCR